MTSTAVGIAQAKYYVTADDTTGAGEVAAELATAGWRVRLAGGPGAVVGGGYVPVLSAETRNVPGSAARDSVLGLHRRLDACGLVPLFHKVDSALRGNVADELRATAEYWPDAVLYFCPATPQRGRIVIDGQLLVDGANLAHTFFATDPTAPAESGDVARLLSRVGLQAYHLGLGDLRATERVLASRVLRALDAGTRLISADAARSSDLAALVGVAHVVGRPAVFVGAGGLARAVANANTARLGRGEACRWIVLCTSLHPTSRMQVLGLRKEGVWLSIQIEPVVSSTSDPTRGQGTIAQLPSHVRGIIVQTSPEHTVAAHDMARRAAVAAVELAARHGIGNILTVGGDGTAALLNAVGSPSLDVAGFLASDVVVSRPSEPHSFLQSVLMKAGGHGHQATLIDALTEFER